MATALVRGGVPDTDCSVCHDAFKEPKILPCGHVVCRPCLVSRLQAQPQAGCPLCRCAVLETEGQPESLEEEVGALPTDLALAELVEARTLLDKDHTCCVCDDVAATALCLHCGDMLCASCTKAHRKLSMSRHHKVEDLCVLTVDSLAASRPSLCSTQPTEQCKLFCPTHGKSVCVLCAMAKHRDCPDIKNLAEETEEAREALALIAASLSATESQLNRDIRQLNRHIRNTDKRVQDAILHIQKTCERLESGINSCRINMTDQAHRAGSDIKERARAAITILQERKAKVTAHTVVATRAEGSKAHSAVSQMAAVMGTRTQQLNRDVTLTVSYDLTTLTFSIDEKVVSSVEKALSKLGRVHLVPADHLEICQPGDFTFHEDHGFAITLSNNNRTATYCASIDGEGTIAVSREPLIANVLYEVRMDLWDTDNWLGVGVLTVSPDDVDLRSDMGHFLHPVALVCLDGVKPNGTTNKDVVHRLASVMKKVKEGDRVGVSLDTRRRLHLHINGEDRGVWHKAVTGPCHFLIEQPNYDKQQVTALPPIYLEG